MIFSVPLQERRLEGFSNIVECPQKRGKSRRWAYLMGCNLEKDPTRGAASFYALAVAL